MVRRITILHLVPDHRIACFALYKRLLQHCKVLPAGDKLKAPQALAPTSDPDLATGGNSGAVVEHNETKISLGDQVANLIAKTFRKNRRNRTVDQVRELLKRGYEAEQALSQAISGDGDAIGKVVSMLREEHRKGQKAHLHASSYRKMPPASKPSTEIVKSSSKEPPGYEQPIKFTAYHLEKQVKPVVPLKRQPVQSRNVIIIPPSIASPEGTDATDDKTPRGSRKMRIPSFTHAHGIPLLRYPGIPQPARLSMMIRKKGRVKNTRHLRRDALKSLTSLAETEDEWDELIEQNLSDPEFSISTATTTAATDDMQLNLLVQGEDLDGNVEDSNQDTSQEGKWVHEADNALAYVNSLIIHEAKRNFDKGRKLWAIVEEKRRQRDAIRAETKRLRRKRYRDRRRGRDETFGIRRRKTNVQTNQKGLKRDMRKIEFQKQIRQKGEPPRTPSPRQMKPQQQRARATQNQTRLRPAQEPKHRESQNQKQQPPRPGGSFSGRWV